MKPIPKLKVKVIGTGGIGHCLLPCLTRVLAYGSAEYTNAIDKNTQVELHLVDGDDYEERNRDRQGFDRRGNKAEVTADKLRAEFVDVDFFSHPVFIMDDNAKFLIEEDDVVFLCVDNHKTRKLVSDHCAGLDNVTLISGGNGLTDGNVQWYIRREGKDITPSLTAVHAEIANPTDEHPAEVTRKQGCDALVVTTPQLLIANNAAATLMLAAFHRFLKGFLGQEGGVKALFAHDESFFDLNSGKFRTVNNKSRIS